jgi:DNA gyrase subunit A
LSEKIIDRSLSEELKTSYLNYALSVIISRALPDVRDGLKPVHRRILYAMELSNLTYNRPFRKSAYVVGQVISSYHPHGDVAIYESLVRMAQNFSLRYPLIDGQGNFGSMDGDKAAAYRYTEARMAKITDELLLDLDKDTVDFVKNFDDSKIEPTVLPSAIPNLLINGSSGIAVGMATNIPPHNLNEIIDAVNFYINKQEATTEELMQFVKGPDFPTSGIVHGYSGIKLAYKSGRGLCKIRSRYSIEEYKKEQEAIIITEIPYQVNKSEMIKKMADLVKSEVVVGISEIRDESDRNGIRVVIELKKGIIVKQLLIYFINILL